MKGAAAALRAGDLVRVCERLERIAKRLPDQHESDATPRALVADVAAKLRALAADAAELRRVSTFPVAHAATRHGEALATKLGALVLVAARAFRLSVEVRAEMETVRSRGDDARVGSARRVSETQRRLFSETRARRRSLDDGARNDFLATFAAARALRDTERDAEATGARELALAARELWREIRDAAASSWRVNALKLAAFQRALEAFAWDAWVVLGSAMPDVERALGSGESSRESRESSRESRESRESGTPGRTSGTSGSALSALVYARRATAKPAYHEGRAVRAVEDATAARWSRESDPRRASASANSAAPRWNSLASMSSLSAQVVSTRSNAPSRSPTPTRRTETDAETTTTTTTTTMTSTGSPTTVEDAPCDLRVGFGDFGDDDASFALDLLATFVAELRAFVATLVNHDRGGTFARRLTESETRAAANLCESADALVATEMKQALAELSLAGVVEPFDAGAVARAVGRVSRATERVAEYYRAARDAATNRSPNQSAFGKQSPEETTVEPFRSSIEPNRRPSHVERAVRPVTRTGASPSPSPLRGWSEMDVSETSVSGASGERRSLSEGTRRRSRALPPRSVHIRDVYKSGLYDSSTSGDGDAGRSSLDGSDARARRWSRSGTTTSDLSSRSASDEGTSSGSGARSWSSVPVGREEAYVAALAATSPRERRRELRGVRFPKPREAVIDVADLVSRSGGDWDFACARARKYAAAAREQCETLELVLRRPRKHPSRAVVDALAQCRSIAKVASVCHSPPLVDALAALEAALEKSLAKLPEERDADRGDGDGENDGVEAGVLQRARAPNETDVDWRARVERLTRALRRRVRQYEWASDALSRVDTFSPETAFYAVRRRSAGDEDDDGHGDGSAGKDVSAEYAAGEAKLRDLASGMTVAYFLAVDAACAAESTFGAVACGLTSAAGASTSSLEHDEDDGDDDESSEREDVDALFARLDSARTALGTMEARARGVGARGCERALAWARGGLDMIAREMSVIDVGSSGKRAGVACFFGDEHRAMITTLVSLKREVEDFARDHHAVAPNETPDVWKIAASAEAARHEHRSGGKTRRAGFERATSAMTTRELRGDAGDAGRRFEKAAAVDFARSAVVVAVAVMTWQIIAAARNVEWAA